MNSQKESQHHTNEISEVYATLRDMITSLGKAYFEYRLTASSSDYAEMHLHYAHHQKLLERHSQKVGTLIDQYSPLNRQINSDPRSQVFGLDQHLVDDFLHSNALDLDRRLRDLWTDLTPEILRTESRGPISRTLDSTPLRGLPQISARTEKAS